MEDNHTFQDYVIGWLWDPIVITITNKQGPANKYKVRREKKLEEGWILEISPTKDRYKEKNKREKNRKLTKTEVKKRERMHGKYKQIVLKYIFRVYLVQYVKFIGLIPLIFPSKIGWKVHFKKRK